MTNLRNPVARVAVTRAWRLIPAWLLILAAMTAATASADAPAPRHVIEAEINPASRAVSVTDRLTIEGRDTVRFRVAPWMTVESARLNGAAVGARADGDIWTVALPDSGRHRVDVALRGTIPPLPAPNSRHRAGPGVAGPEGSHLPWSAGWLPVTDDPWVGYRLTVSVPADQRAVATGRLIEEQAGADRYVATFVGDFPAEPPSLFIGPYRIRERQLSGLRLRTYFTEPIAEFADRYLDASAAYIARFSEEIGPYPFADFHVISSPLPVGLGYPNLTYIGQRIVPLPFMQGRSLAHEVLHNWWGNGVAVAHAQGNWSEGLTTYMADHAVEAERRGDDGREMRLAWLRDYAALPAERDVPVTQFRSKRHQASQVIGYNKVAHVFHMLRLHLGDATFTEGIRRFWTDHQRRIAGWGDIRATFEAVSDRDLGWFFAQWLDRAGAPRVMLDAVRPFEGTAAPGLSITLRQARPPYRLDVPVEVETDAGVVREVLRLDDVRGVYRIETPGRPLRVRVDAAHDLFRHLLPGETVPILRDVTLARDVSVTVLSEARDYGSAAMALVRRMVDRGARLDRTDGTPTPGRARIVVGDLAALSDWMAEDGLGAVPDPVVGSLAAAWATRDQGGSPTLLIVAEDAGLLSGMIRSLPHYGRQSYVVISGDGAPARGLWTPDANPMEWDLRAAGDRAR